MTERVLFGLLGLVLGVALGMVAEYSIATDACERYYKVLPVKERPLVCREVLGRKP